MKNLLLIIAVLSLVVTSCKKSDDKDLLNDKEKYIELSGSYEHYTDIDMGTFTLELKENGEFYKSIDLNTVDPNYWYGTYEILNDTIVFDTHEDFQDTEEIIRCAYNLDGDTLTLTIDPLYPQIWYKTDEQ